MSTQVQEAPQVQEEADDSVDHICCGPCSNEVAVCGRYVGDLEWTEDTYEFSEKDCPDCVIAWYAHRDHM